MVEIKGTVWKPKYKITKRLTGLREQNELYVNCSGAKNSGTKNILKIEFFSGKTSLGKKSKTGCSKSFRKWSNPTRKMTHFTITTTGHDAAWFDYVKLNAQWSGRIAKWGRKGGKGYCLSTDPKDAKPWGKKVDKSCYRKFKFVVSTGKVSAYH